jgi:hypothetical protein
MRAQRHLAPTVTPSITTISLGMGMPVVTS